MEAVATRRKEDGIKEADEEGQKRDVRRGMKKKGGRIKEEREKGKRVKNWV